MAKRERKPQINFQVEDPMKMLYDEAKASGHWVTRFCAAGFLLMVEDVRVRTRAINRLRAWEAEFDGANENQIHDFVQGARDAMRSGARGSRRGPRARPAKKRAKRG